MGHDDIGLPVADQPCDRAAMLERRLQFAVVDVEHLRGDLEDACRFLDFVLAALGERAAGHLPVPDVAVGDGDELDVMPELRPLRRGAAGLQLAIIRMGAEADDAQLAVLG